jgi:hypothetical protein
VVNQFTQAEIYFNSSFHNEKEILKGKYNKKKRGGEG